MPERKRDKRTWGALRVYALALPGAWEDFPWDEVVVKVGKKIFVFLGRVESAEHHITIKLTESHAPAMTVTGAVPAGYGLGKAGWVTLPLTAVDRGDLEDWVEESYRNVAPKKLIKQLDDGARP